MDFQIDKRHAQLKESIITFAKRELDHGIDQDACETFPAQSWEKCAKFGIMRLPVARDYGGEAVDSLGMIFAMEGLGYGCLDNGLVFAIANHMFACMMLMQKFGNAKQKGKYLPELANGNRIAAHAMTEANSGSDSFSMQTRAIRHGDQFILNGTKTFITNAPVADVFIVFAKTSESKNLENVSAFIVEKNFPGLKLGKTISKMGLRSSLMGEVVLSDCAGAG